jgi:hypothetical protein
MDYPPEEGRQRSAFLHVVLLLIDNHPGIPSERIGRNAWRVHQVQPKVAGDGGKTSHCQRSGNGGSKKGSRLILEQGHGQMELHRVKPLDIAETLGKTEGLSDATIGLFSLTNRPMNRR